MREAISWINHIAAPISSRGERKRAHHRPKAAVLDFANLLRPPYLAPSVSRAFDGKNGKRRLASSGENDAEATIEQRRPWLDHMWSDSWQAARVAHQGRFGVRDRILRDDSIAVMSQKPAVDEP